MIFLQLLLLLLHNIMTISGHSSRPHLPFTDYTLERHDDTGLPNSNTDFGDLGLMAKVEAMAAKMERMEEMFLKREEQMKLELKELEQRVEMRETKIRAELDTIREAPQVFTPPREIFSSESCHLFHYLLTGTVLRVPEQMEFHRNSYILPIHLKLQQRRSGVHIENICICIQIWNLSQRTEVEMVRWTSRLGCSQASPQATTPSRSRATLLLMPGSTTTLTSTIMDRW